MGWLPQPITGKERPLTSVHPRHTLGDAHKKAESLGQVGAQRHSDGSRVATRAQLSETPQPPLSFLSPPLLFFPCRLSMPPPLGSLPRPLQLAASPEALGDPQTVGHFQPHSSVLTSDSSQPHLHQLRGPRPGTTERSESQGARSPACYASSCDSGQVPSPIRASVPSRKRAGLNGTTPNRLHP